MGAEGVAVEEGSGAGVCGAANALAHLCETETALGQGTEAQARRGQTISQHARAPTRQLKECNQC